MKSVQYRICFVPSPLHLCAPFHFMSVWLFILAFHSRKKCLFGGLKRTALHLDLASLSLPLSLLHIQREGVREKEREGVREKERERKKVCVFLCECMGVFVFGCVCVRERDRESQNDLLKGRKKSLHNLEGEGESPTKKKCWEMFLTFRFYIAKIFKACHRPHRAEQTSLIMSFFLKQTQCPPLNWITDNRISFLLLSNITGPIISKQCTKYAR